MAWQKPSYDMAPSCKGESWHRLLSTGNINLSNSFSRGERRYLPLTQRRSGSRCLRLRFSSMTEPLSTKYFKAAQLGTILHVCAPLSKGDGIRRSSADYFHIGQSTSH